MVSLKGINCSGQVKVFAAAAMPFRNLYLREGTVETSIWLKHGRVQHGLGRSGTLPIAKNGKNGFSTVFGSVGASSPIVACCNTEKTYVQISTTYPFSS